MYIHRGRLISMLALVSAACSTGTTESFRSGSLNTTIRAINASASQLTVIVDADSVIKSVQVAGISAAVAITPGTHQIRFVSGATTSVPMMVNVAAGHSIVAVGRGAASSGITSSVLADTGAIVPAGKSKLRVVHLSASAGNIEIFRTQPDYQLPSLIMTPFPYGAESPYLQSDPGNWEVFVTAAGSSTKLTTTGPINIPPGERRTAILLDSAGNKFFRIIEQ